MSYDRLPIALPANDAAQANTLRSLAVEAIRRSYSSLISASAGRSKSGRSLALESVDPCAASHGVIGLE